MISSLFGREEPQKSTDSAGESGAEPQKRGFFDRMKQAVSRTRESFSAKIADLAAMTRTVDESALDELESALLTSDLGVQTTTAILDALRDRARHQAIEGGAELRDLLKEQLRAILDAPRRDDSRACGAAESHVSGRRERHRQNHFERQAGRVEPRTGTVGAAVRGRHIPCRGHRAARSVGWALRRGDDQDAARAATPRPCFSTPSPPPKRGRSTSSIVDTAGRLHTKSGLMDELDKMRRTAARLVPGAPHEVLLVMDATTGQNGLQQARQFTQAAGVTGIVLTKLDGTAKGGIAVAIARELSLPVRYVGVGEKMEDLLEFSPAEFVDSLLE